MLEMPGAKEVSGGEVIAMASQLLCYQVPLQTAVDLNCAINLAVSIASSTKLPILKQQFDDARNLIKRFWSLGMVVTHHQNEC